MFDRLNPGSRSEPVLIGPAGAGKSAVAKALSVLTCQPVVCLDSIRPLAFPLLGADVPALETLFHSAGFEAFSEACRPFERQLLNLTLDAHANCIFDVGAGFVLHDANDPPVGNQDVIRRFKNVVHVCASIDQNENAFICQERLTDRFRMEGLTEFDAPTQAAQTSAYFAAFDNCYKTLSTLTLPTGHRSPIDAACLLQALLMCR